MRIIRNLFDWELGELCRVLSLLENCRPDPNKANGWEWVINRESIFTPKSLYVELLGTSLVPFSCKGICNPGIPSKVFLFMECIFG